MPQPFIYSESTALVTGASRGIGAEIVRALTEKSVAALVLTARDRHDLETLTDEIHTVRPAMRVEIIVADLSQSDAPSRIKAETDRLGLTVDLLVNNAGFGSHGFFDTLPPDKEQAMVGVNVASLVALTRLYLPGMVAQKRGAVVNIASTASFQPVPFMATYGATKAFVLSFSEALWAENRARFPDADLRIVCVCPGGTETQFAQQLGSARGKFENTPQTSPQQVARETLDALDADVSYHVVGRANYVATWGARILPRAVMARFTARLFRPGDVPPAISDSDAIQKRNIVAVAALAASVAAGLIAVDAVKKRRG